MLSSLHIFYYFYFKIYRLIDYIEIGLTSLPNALQKKKRFNQKSELCAVIFFHFDLLSRFSPFVVLDSMSFDPRSFDPMSFDPLSLDPLSFDSLSFDPMPFDPMTFDLRSLDPRSFDTISVNLNRWFKPCSLFYAHLRINTKVPISDFTLILRVNGSIILIYFPIILE